MSGDDAILKSLGFRSIKGLDIGILQTSPDRRIRYINAKMGQILGIDRSQMKDHLLSEVDTQPWGKDLLASLADRVAASRQPVEQEIAYRTGDGPTRHVLIKTATEGGQIQFLVEDRTPLRQVESMFKRYVSPAVVERMRTSPDDVAKLLKAERQELSLLYVTLQDFTAVTERGNPELIRSSLNQFIGEMVAAADAFEAAVTKIQAPSLMFLFGAPIPAPDHPRRAVAAAMRMRKSHERLHRSWTFLGLPGLGFQAAVHTGPCILGNIGCERMMDFNVFGWNVDAARLLCESAKPGEILLTKSAHDALAPLLAASPLEEPVKFADRGRTAPAGLRQEIQVYAVERG